MSESYACCGANLRKDVTCGCGVCGDTTHIASGDSDGCGGGAGFKLFGVCLTTNSPPSACSSSTSMRKSFSMGNLSNYGSSDGLLRSGVLPAEQPDYAEGNGYASDDLVHSNSSTRERKKGVPWSEEEHRLFLLGLEKLGKGDWRGISRSFVKSRTPTQVASHAQKYFLRRSNLNKRRRRSSLFDITPDNVPMVLEESVLEEQACENVDACAELPIGWNAAHHDELGGQITVDYQQPMDVSVVGLSEIGSTSGTSACFPQFPLMGVWPTSSEVVSGKPFLLAVESNLVKPTPRLPTLDAKLNMPENGPNFPRPVMEPTPLSYKLLEEGSRHSAFHTMPSNSSNELDGQGNSNAISVS